MPRRSKEWDGEDRRGPPAVVVVGEDDGSNELLCRILRARGYDAAAARTPEAAMGEVLARTPRCVVIDLASGGIGSSLRLLEQIRTSGDRRIATTRVVLVARNASNRVFSYQAGADAFLLRPFHADELLQAVSESISRPQTEILAHRRAAGELH